MVGTMVLPSIWGSGILKKVLGKIFRRREEIGRVIEGTDLAVQVGNFGQFAFPLRRQVFPNLIAQDLVSVQPMDRPVGLIFYFDQVEKEMERAPIGAPLKEETIRTSNSIWKRTESLVEVPV